jgi:3-deoxy-manno-octulosonate cytidylyltransferase (CMP-KDO synthetase)
VRRRAGFLLAEVDFFFFAVDRVARRTAIVPLLVYGEFFTPSISTIGRSQQSFSTFFAQRNIIILMVRVLAIIPARYGSSRFPGKMLAQIRGKSLIQHTVENAQRCSRIHRLVVATDDQRIAEHVARLGIEPLLTSPDCLTGTDRVAQAVANYRQLDGYDLVVNLQGDEPAIHPNTVSAVVDCLIESPDAAMATPVTPLSCGATLARSSVVKCVFDQRGYALYFSRSLIPLPHRDPATFYRHIGLYAFRHSFLMQYAQLKPTPLERSEDLEQLRFLESGYRIRVAIVDEFHPGIDTPEDALALERQLNA